MRPASALEAVATPSAYPRASAHLEREAFLTAALEPKMAVVETAEERLPVRAGLKAEVEAAERRRVRAETRIFGLTTGGVVIGEMQRTMMPPWLNLCGHASVDKSTKRLCLCMVTDRPKSRIQAQRSSFKATMTTRTAVDVTTYYLDKLASGIPDRRLKDRC